MGVNKSPVSKRRLVSMAIGRRTLFLFLFGIAVGFLTTSVFLLFQSNVGGTGDGRSQSSIASSGFLPDLPHSHGHQDDLVQPGTEGKAQHWSDFEDDSHHSTCEFHGPTIASELKQKVRILCWVMTSPFNLEDRARHINATWGQRCNILVFMSSISDPSFSVVGLNVTEGHDNLWAKTKAAFRYVYEHYFYKADWFLKADDDTYVVVENLRYLLKDYDPSEPLYFGRRFRPYVSQGYMSGGAGYVLSREALKRLVTVALPSSKMCSQMAIGDEDVEIGLCLQRCGVRAMDSRDKLGRERFHPFPPYVHLIEGYVPRDDNWLWQYNYYPLREGPECCSDYAVTFHYISPQLMYVFEYLVHHVRPYGLLSDLILPLSKSRLQEAGSESEPNRR